MVSLGSLVQKLLRALFGSEKNSQETLTSFSKNKTMQFRGKKEVVKAVQKLLGVSADGVDGPVTWNAVLARISTKNELPPKGDIAEKMVSLARGEIGVSEVDGSNCGPRVDQYKAATWLDADKGWPWCAAFICWLVREAIEGEDLDDDGEELDIDLENPEDVKVIHDEFKKLYDSDENFR